ncbi:MAG: hypothetical protein QOF89_1908 [Acidobacteriota bacterium]|jgi:hypothetical protein|nr:hypothetical protein [Acidobacteriota bacterium]
MQLIKRIVLAVLATTFCGGVLAAGTLESDAGQIDKAIGKSEVFKYRDKAVTFEITAAGNATASYFGAPNQRIINVVVIRGEQNDLRVDPEAPPYALDIRIADNENIVLTAQSGTGHFVDKAWGQELSAVPQLIDDERRERDIAELTYFANALREKVKPRLGKSELLRWAWVIDELVSLMDYTEAQRELAPVLDDDSPKATATYSNVVTIKKKTAFNIVFEHSALSYSLYKSNGSSLYTIVTCNHGACASASSMSTKCSKTFTQSTVDGWASDLLCDLFVFNYPWGHACNNDTRAEYLSIKNRSRGSWGSCSGIKLYAPACD